MTHEEIAEEVKTDDARIVLAYTFNTTGQPPRN